MTTAAPHPLDPERMLIVPRLVRPGEPPRYLLVQWRDWPPPALLSLDPPTDAEGLRVAIGETVSHRIGVEATGAPLFTAARQPVRMSKRMRGGDGLGWLRAAVVDVAGSPAPDPLLEAVLEFQLDDALAALTTDVERTLLIQAAALVGDTPGALEVQAPSTPTAAPPESAVPSIEERDPPAPPAEA